MELKPYELERSKDNYAYEFYSEGPGGRIKKTVQFQHLPKLGQHVYNLAFGVLDELMDRVNDLAISNNNDRERVLRTVASAVMDFLERVPPAIILIQDSTLSRTRLYQMKMAVYWKEINKYCDVYGEFKKEWHSFRTGVNYERFLVFRKIK